MPFGEKPYSSVPSVSEWTVNNKRGKHVIAGEIKAKLLEQGHRPVYFEHGIPAGRNWEKELYARLRCGGGKSTYNELGPAFQWE
ncbi:MAG: hypothetical protein ACREXW_07910 [Gammaproteobacteria bacterium]